MERTTMKYMLGTAALVFILTGASANAHVTDDGNQPLSNRSAKQLIRHASSAQDYQKLTAYFLQKAESLEKQAGYYEKQANDYPSSTGIHPKVPYPGGWGLYCQYLASQYSLDAQKAPSERREVQGSGRGRSFWEDIAKIAHWRQFHRASGFSRLACAASAARG
jgi:hypothetical protein